jgi:hypothetical protein
MQELYYNLIPMNHLKKINKFEDISTFVFSVGGRGTSASIRNSDL